MMQHHALTVACRHVPFEVYDALGLNDAERTVLDRERLSIADVHELVRVSRLTPRLSDKVVFLVEVQQVAIEAQHALLKLFEEPPAHARFILATPHPEALLPTLRSRLQVVDGPTAADQTGIFKEWLAGTFADRLQTVADRCKNKDTAWQQALLHDVEVRLASYADAPEVRMTLLRLVSNWYLPGASIKMLLEDTALSLPAVEK